MVGDHCHERALFFVQPYTGEFVKIPQSGARQDLSSLAASMPSPAFTFQHGVPWMRIHLVALMIVGFCLAALPSQAAEPSATGLWEQYDDATGKVSGWFYVSE